MPKIETVKVKTKDGFMIINKCDVTKEHSLFSEKKESNKKDKK